MTVNLLFMLVVLKLNSQGIYCLESCKIATHAQEIKLKNTNIISNTVKVRQEKNYELTQVLDYEIDNVNGILKFTEFYNSNRRAKKDSIEIEVEYYYLQVKKNTLQLLTVGVKNNDTTDKKEQSKSNPILTSNEIFGKDFKRSGSITRGLSIGSNQDLTLNSGMRIQFSGKITDDLEVSGVLSDEQTPIQPEGTTQTIKDIENIYVAFNSKNFNGIVGKFNTRLNNDFLSIDKKIQGVLGEYKLQNNSKFKAVVGLAQGKIGYINLQGKESVQGPYRLLSDNGEKNIIIIAGSERVYVNGELQIRGLSNDYIIDYSSGEINFQQRRIITSFSKIEVDYEYMNENYTRSFMALANRTTLVDSVINLEVQIERESDDKTSPINATLSPEDLDIIKFSDSKKKYATKQSAYYVGRNDSIIGNYVRQDTVINNIPKVIYKYDPTNIEANYEVGFTYVGEFEGEYRNKGFGNYEFVGENNGNYLPIKYLPIPNEQIKSSIKLGVGLGKNIEIKGGGNYIYEKPNLIAERPDNIEGYQINTEGKLNFAEYNLSKALDLSVGFRTRNENYAEDGRNFDITKIQDNSDDIEKIIADKKFEEIKSRLNYEPIEGLTLYNENYKISVQNSEYKNINQIYGAEFKGKNQDWKAKTEITLIEIDSQASNKLKNWIDYKIGLNKKFGSLEFDFSWKKQNRKVMSATDSKEIDGWGGAEYGLIGKLITPNYKLISNLTYSEIDSIKRENGNYTTSKYNSITTTLQNENTFTENIKQKNNLTIRNIFNSEANTNLTNKPSTILLKTENKINLLDNLLKIDLNYEANSQLIGKIEKFFVKVPITKGEYVWKDINNDKIQQENEFFITNNGDGEFLKYEAKSDNLIPAIDVKADLRIITDFNNLSTYNFIKNTRLETIFKINEKNQGGDKTDIYLLNLSKYQNKENTISGNTFFQQNINLFERDENVTIKLKFIKKSGIINYVSYKELQNSNEAGGGVYLKLTEDIKNKTDIEVGNGYLAFENDNNNFGVGRAYNMESKKYENEFSYLAIKDLDLSWKIKVKDIKDRSSNKKDVFLLTNIFKANYAIGINGRLRIELEKSNIDTKFAEEDIIPYQMSEGYSKGDTWVGTINLDYRLGSNIQLNLGYVARALPPTKKVIHTGQTEIKAFF